ncbi:MAG: 4Fe-4S binding protein [Planctomycetaceae bacterium]|jgi:NAD-dependent dihydropyrimidine dehydrogenase PreA subunit|nr:4Fe-4S binding protein [Planctomycetaceae bacterium]
MAVKVNQEECTACGSCVSNCPFEAIKIAESTNKAEIDGSTCQECGACISECPVSAISD